MEQAQTACIAVSAATYAIDRPYTYLLPGGLGDQAKPGMRALVPFGQGNRPTEGIILSLGVEETSEYRLKPVIALLDDEPVVDEKGLKLALWMRERLFCTVYDGVRAMLPAGLSVSLKERWQLRPGMDRETAYQAAGSSAAAKKLLDILYANHGGISEGDLRTAFGEQSPTRALSLLKKAGVVEAETSASRQIGDKTEQYATLAVSVEEAQQMLESTRRRYPIHQSVVELVARLERVPATELCYYTGASKATLKTLMKKGILNLEHQEVYRTPVLEEVDPEEPPILNEEQQTAFDGLSELLDQNEASCSLLYGITGSGKTQVYIRLIHRCLEQGKDAILLVPEIALTPQMLRQLRSQFGKQVAVLHSMLTGGARYDEWKRIRRGEARVVVGTRSAVFAPVEHLGLIILDEEQEYSYKSEQSPRYHARDVAKYRSVQNHSMLLLGSATPSVESMFLAKSGKYHLFTLRNRYNQKALPQVVMADLKTELRNGNPGSLSQVLLNEIRENLSRGEQSILFLNRRGSSKMVVCAQCGQVPTCDRCSVGLTYHKDNNRLMCHYCGYSRSLPRACPVCGGELTFMGCGTQKVEEELHQRLPQAQVLRMDTDTVSLTNTHEKILKKFQEEKIPILVGTQMVAKGLDFENVTLVGVVNADQSLFVDDFRAAERTFGLITQVVGRAGRGSRSGRAVIQTCSPKNEVLRLAAAQDYDHFYENEISLRRLSQYPPFCELYRITISGENEGAVLRAGVRLRDGANQWALTPALQQAQVKVYGPVAAAVLKVNNRYRYHLHVYGKSCPELRKMLSHLLTAAFQDKQNNGVSVFVDWNPLD
jgi:primosomal protein N' (replication factor Y)